jgi:hypothetical protein
MTIGDARISTTQQNLGWWNDGLNSQTDSTVDPTEARRRNDPSQ